MIQFLTCALDDLVYPPYQQPRVSRGQNRPGPSFDHPYQEAFRRNPANGRGRPSSVLALRQRADTVRSTQTSSGILGGLLTCVDMGSTASIVVLVSRKESSPCRAGKRNSSGGSVGACPSDGMEYYSRQRDRRVQHPRELIRADNATRGSEGWPVKSSSHTVHGRGAHRHMRSGSGAPTYLR